MSAVGKTAPAPASEEEVPPGGRGLRGGLNRRSLSIGVGIAVVVFIVGLLLFKTMSSDYYAGIIVSGATLGIVALGIGFLAHRSGLVSLGHTTFYGGAAYLVAIATTNWHWSPLAAGLLGFAGGTVLAFGIGALVVRAPGMTFVMLTLAFGQAFYQLVILDSVRSVTGAFDGLSVTFGANASFLGLNQSALATPSKVWPLVWAVLVVVGFVLWLAGRSRFGTLLEGIRENEERARFSGYNTYLPRLAAFTLSGCVASAAGVLFAFTAAYVSPDLLSFTQAGNSLIAAVVGGVGSLVGPVIGAGLYTYGLNKFSSSGSNIDLYTGLALIIVLVFLPGGVAGALGCLFNAIRARIPGRSRDATTPATEPQVSPDADGGPHA
jgi:branched-chain amino acid transport system permease protein